MSKRDTTEYKSWSMMMYRCYNQKHDKYPYYGGRGILVCKRWHTFENFLEDMGKKPDGYQIDRIDNNGNYEPSNCKWSSRSENLRNTSKNTKYVAFGESKCLAEWADDDRCVVSYDTMKARIYRGYSVEDAITFEHQKSGPKGK